MGHGGKRRGAGRKTILSWEEQTWIGASCENRWNDAGRAEARRRIHDADDTFEKLQHHYELIRNIPVSERRKRLQDPTPIGDEDSDHRLDEHILDLRSVIEDRGSQIVTYPPVKAYGHRQRIIEEVAAEATRRYGRPILPSKVDECWKGYRSFLEELRAEDSQDPT